MGLGDRSTHILLSRGKSHWTRIQDFLNGMIDALWLADESLFMHKSKDQKIIKEIVRRLIRSGTYSLKKLVDDWKSFHNWLFHTYAETVTIGELEVPTSSNPFLRLKGLSTYKRILEGTLDMITCQRLSHLVSSRQFPYMGKETEILSQEKFVKVLESDFTPDAQIETELMFCATKIGKICRALRKGEPTSESAVHCSVTSSGELETSIRKGGQAKAVLHDFRRIMSEVSQTDEPEDTPFGKVNRKVNIPLWITAFRSPDETNMLIRDAVNHTRIRFLTEVREGEKEIPGLDEVTGKQMLYVAWRCYLEDKEKGAICCRAEVVPEMGNKARWVTLTKWWVNVLQAPLSHWLIEALKPHPAVFSSFHRQDQAWEACKELVKDGGLQDDEWVLSSDLKDATNAQRWSITKALIRGFVNGFTGIKQSQYFDLVLDMIGPRLVTFPDGEVCLSRTGIMMGEAIAKPSLTLLNLSIEERAYHLQLGDPGYEYIYTDKTGKHTRRFIHIGGDDHIARGRKRYLELITEGHMRAGSHISPGQHGYSRRVVKYTERLLLLPNIQYGKPIDSNDHGKSTIVDSIKDRLMERGQSVQLMREDKNTAIGKSQMLGGALRWLPKDPKYWPLWKLVSIRDLFIKRMGSYLPSVFEHPSLYNHILLPKQIGGLDLYLPGELWSAVMKSPLPTLLLVTALLNDVDVREEVRIFRLLNTNPGSRGLKSIKDLQEHLIAEVYQDPDSFGAVRFKRIRELYESDPDDNVRWTLYKAGQQGWLPVEEYAKRATRGSLFSTLLLGKEEVKNYDTRPLESTYAHIWNMTLDSLKSKTRGLKIPEGVSEQTLLRVLTSSGPDLFIQVPKPEEDDPYFIRMRYEEALLGMPHLIVGHNFVGLKPT